MWKKQKNILNFVYFRLFVLQHSVFLGKSPPTYHILILYLEEVWLKKQQNHRMMLRTPCFTIGLVISALVFAPHMYFKNIPKLFFLGVIFTFCHMVWGDSSFLVRKCFVYTFVCRDFPSLVMSFSTWQWPSQGSIVNSNVLGILSYPLSWSMCQVAPRRYQGNPTNTADLYLWVTSLRCRIITLEPEFESDWLVLSTIPL